MWNNWFWINLSRSGSGFHAVTVRNFHRIIVSRLNKILWRRRHLKRRCQKKSWESDTCIWHKSRWTLLGSLPRRGIVREPDKPDTLCPLVQLHLARKKHQDITRKTSCPLRKRFTYTMPLKKTSASLWQLGKDIYIQSVKLAKYRYQVCQYLFLKSEV